MVRNSLLFGILLILNGIAGYALAESKSLTALIPSALGAILLLCGIISMQADNLRKHAMHLSAVVGLFGVIGAIGNLARSLAKGDPSTLGLTMTLLMGLLSTAYLVLCIRSFKAARLARQAEAGP